MRVGQNGYTTDRHGERCAAPIRLAASRMRRATPPAHNISYPAWTAPFFGRASTRLRRSRSSRALSRAVRLLENGNRQILAFYWPGDVVMPTQSSCQRITAEAVTNCRVQRTAVSGICQQDEPCGAHQVLAETLALRRHHESEKQHGPHCELPLAHSKSFACRPETAVLRLRSSFLEPILRIIWVRPSKPFAVLWPISR